MNTRGNAKCQIPNVKWLMNNDKGARHERHGHESRSYLTGVLMVLIR
jgi:hypothetical protein